MNRSQQGEGQMKTLSARTPATAMALALVSSLAGPTALAGRSFDATNVITTWDRRDRLRPTNLLKGHAIEKARVRNPRPTDLAHRLTAVEWAAHLIRGVGLVLNSKVEPQHRADLIAWTHRLKAMRLYEPRRLRRVQQKLEEMDKLLKATFAGGGHPSLAAVGEAFTPLGKVEAQLIWRVAQLMVADAQKETRINALGVLAKVGYFARRDDVVSGTRSQPADAAKSSPPPTTTLGKIYRLPPPAKANDPTPGAKRKHAF